MTEGVRLFVGNAWSRERWSFLYVGLCVVAAIAPEPFVRDRSGLFPLPFLLALVVFALGLIPLIFALVSRRPKLVLSSLAGMAIIASDFWTLPLLNRMIDDVVFWREKAFFDRMVVERRTKGPAGQPIRMVVEYEDRSVFVTASLFEYVIYDETDRAHADASSITGFWPCPSSGTGIISVDGNESGPKSIERITGHFYRMFTD